MGHVTTPTNTTLVKSVPMTTSGLRTATSTPRVTTMLMAELHLLARPLMDLLTSRRLHTAKVPNTGAASSPTGTLGAVTRTSTRRSLMMTPGPNPTLPSPTMNGTTVMPTNGAARLGDATVTSTVPHPTVARPLLTNITDTPRRAAMAAMAVLHTPRAAPTGVVHLRLAVQLMPDTTTTPGPNRPMVRTRMPDGASLTTASPLALTTTRSTPDGSRLMMTSGLRTTTASTTPMPVHTARPLPSGLIANPAKRDGANPTGALVANTTKPLALDVLLLMANPDLTGTHGAVTRTSRSTNHMNRHGLSPTMLSHMTNGTTSTEINGAPRHGARTAIFTVLLHTMVLLPLLTTPTKPMAAKLDMPRAETLMVASLMAVQNLLLTTRPPQARRPLLVPTMPTHGPSRLTALTTTPGGASPMSSSTPTSTTMSSTPARCALTTTSWPRTGMSTPRRMPTFMAKPQAWSALNQRSPRPLTHLMSAMADMAMVMAATDGEHHT